jgi:hypothetical protein
MLEKKVDGRKFNGGNKGCGRKSKSDERQLVEKLTPLEDEALAILFKKVLEGDKDMLKLYMSYMYGNPKVSTSNETTMTVSTVELKDIISFDNKPDNFFDED